MRPRAHAMTSSPSRRPSRGCSTPPVPFRAGAGRSTSVANSSLTLVFTPFRVAAVVQRRLEPAEVLGPETGQELLHRAEPAGVDHEQMTGALAALVDQAGLAQDLQV